MFDSMKLLIVQNHIFVVYSNNYWNIFVCFDVSQPSKEHVQAAPYSCDKLRPGITSIKHFIIMGQHNRREQLAITTQASVSTCSPPLPADTRKLPFMKMIPHHAWKSLAQHSLMHRFCIFCTGSVKFMQSSVSNLGLADGLEPRCCWHDYDGEWTSAQAGEYLMRTTSLNLLNS